MNYTKMSNDQLFSSYAKAAKLLAMDLKHVASLWCEMQRRGLDLTQLRQPLAKYFPGIAAGRVMPEVVIAFAGCESVLDLAVSLGLKQQAEIIAPGATVPVVSPSGSVVHRKPTELRVVEAKQVFADRRILTPQEQRAVMPKPKVIALPGPVSKPLGTTMEAAFVAADYELRFDRGLQIAVQAWTKWPGASDHRMRVKHATEQMRAATGQMFWNALAALDPRLVNQAVHELLRTAEASIARQSPREARKMRA